jgi:ATP-binding cassette subfamily C protein
VALALLAALALLISLFEIATAGMTAVFAQVITDPQSGAKTLQKALFFLSFEDVVSPHRALFVAAVGIGSIYLIKNVLTGIELFARQKAIATISIATRERVLFSYANLDYGQYLTKNSSFYNAIVSGAGTACGALVPVFSILSEGLIAIGLCSFVFSLNPLVTGILFGLIGVFFFVFSKWVLPIFSRLGERLFELGFLSSQSLYEFFHAFKEVILLNKREVFIGFCQKYGTESENLGVLKNTAQELPRLVVECVFVGLFVGVILFSCAQEALPSTLMAALGGYFYAGFRLLPSINRISSQWAAFEGFLPMIDSTYREMQKNLHAESLQPCPELTLIHSLSLKNVSFQYLNTSREVLSDITLEIQKGEMLGIVGTTGSGKSTLIDLILGLLKPCSGEILLDGRFPVASSHWHRKIGYVPQALYLVDGTITANVAFGCGDQVDVARLHRVLAEAQLKDLVDSLPLKEETIVGERGIRLSGGERQRVAIARALYNNPEVLIFDEATSSLDSPTEARLMETICHVSSGKTVIMVAHRWTTLRECNRIVVMKKGKIEKIVSYEELVREQV